MGWTYEQQKAIDTRDRTLLISAAAGSGKTATLTERIIQSILDEENPTDISRMLIATYTNAAVDELRERIGKAIKEAVQKHPENTRLEEQLLKLKDAKILTITAFCNSILRSSAETIGLAPNYRIAEPAEAKIISSAVLEGLINAAYENEIPEVCTADEFIAVADCISNIKHSEGLSEAISFIFEKLTYSERGIDTLSELIEEYNPEKFESVEKTKMGAYVIRELKEALSSYEVAYETLISLATAARLDEKNLHKAESDLGHIRKILAESTYERILLLLNAVSFESLSKGKEDVTDFYAGFKFLRPNFKDDINSFRDKLFFYSSDEWRELYAKLYKLLGILYKFLKKYYDVFMEEKRSRGICEFSDVERYAYDALCNSDGTPTPLAKELSDKFDAIYVDEYQDVNALQGQIFAAISKPNNRFMVGDIKQSIYGFRSARPGIFLDMKNKFPLIDSDGDYPAASIFMSNNFRCDSLVVDFVNGVFDRMFGLFADNIGYVSEDRLKFTKKYKNGAVPRGIVPEIHIIEGSSKPKTDDGSEDEADKILAEEKSKNELQAEAIAKKISELLRNGALASGKQIQPSDVAILMRSVKGTLAEAVTNALKRHGIPSSINETGDLFLCEEVLLALSLFYSIDNPKKDVYLCAVMLSPLYNFTADEVFKIRKSSEAETLWDSILSYVKENPDYTRGRSFIASILKYRRLSEGERSDTLISILYRESGLMTLASKNGSRDNLILLHSYARKYESDGFKGLYSFINYINAVIERGETFPAAQDAEESNAVRIMTVHRSKGLEFPVTILAGASSAGSKDKGGKIFFHESFGIAIRTKDDTGLAIIDNPVSHAINRYIKAVEFDEELRVLYVALTRAREQLYIYASSPKENADEYLEYVERMRDILNPYFASKSKSFLDTVMFSRNCGKLIIESAKRDEEEEKEETAESTDFRPEEATAHASARDYISRFSFEYKKSHLEKLPKKISVSRLSPAMLNDDENAVGIDEISIVENYLSETASVPENKEYEDTSAPIIPAFISGKSEGESAKRGIATHKVLQFCDFGKLEQSPDEELKRLVELEYVSREDGERVRKNELKAFVKSPLFSEIKRARNLHRELRFNVYFDASEFTDKKEKKALLENEKILVQGVIDCLIEREDGSLHLVDYKTDRLSREELSDEALAEERLRRSHTLQLSYYKKAVEQIFGKTPSSVGIYSLHLGREVTLDV